MIFIRTEVGDTCKECFNATLREMMRSLWTTIETGGRGFLLGFGTAILKDLLIDRKGSGADESKLDFTKTLQFAKLVGLGSSCFMVGIAIVLPARLRAEMFAPPGFQ